jgi:hypothetical protein
MQEVSVGFDMKGFPNLKRLMKDLSIVPDGWTNSINVTSFICRKLASKVCM